MSRFLLTLPAIAVILVAASPAFAADYAVRTRANGDVVLTVSGAITPVDGAAFLLEANRYQPRIVELEPCDMLRRIENQLLQLPFR